MEKISIIIPVYNVEKYLDECLVSVLNQTYRSFEVILVDDGSTDRSGFICDEYANKDARIKVIHGKNVGPVKARKIGLENAEGSFIAFADADDWLESNMLERLVDTLVNEKVDIAMCARFEDTGDTRREVYHGIPEGRYDKQEMLDKVYPNMIVNGSFFEWGIFPGLWDKIFRRELIEKFWLNVDDRITMGDDAACVYPCLLNADSIYILHECLYHYRQTPVSMVKQKVHPDVERERFKILYNTVLESLKQYRNIYDLTEQWQEYILFLMTPRADTLYENIEGLDYLFPFPKVKKNSKIVLYGMGTYGQRLYKFIKETDFCNLVLLADRNYKELQKQGIPVQSPDDIAQCEYDAIVVASSFAKARTAIYKDLTARYPKEKVHVMDEALIKSQETLKKFGLII